MIRIVIGGSERTYEDASPQWINEQINRRRHDGVPVCVRVHIQEGRIAGLMLSSNGCPPSGGGGRRPLTAEEQEMYRLWQHFGLSDEHFTGGQLIAFLKRLR